MRSCRVGINVKKLTLMPATCGINTLVTPKGATSKRRGLIPRQNFYMGQKGWLSKVRELSVMVDESGGEQGNSKYYLLTLVFHDQADDIEERLGSYERSLADAGLPNYPFHASPLMNGHDDYESCDAATRKVLLSKFNVFVQRLPIRYKTFCYRRSELGDRDAHSTRMRRDISTFLFEHLDYFQQFDKVKVYYDDGQQIVSEALHASIEFALAKEATLFKRGTYGQYRLLQAADYLCAIELAAVKYEAHEETSTDLKFFGGVGNFKKNWLKQARRKRID